MPTLQPLRHTGPVRIETERLILRPTSMDDAEQMFSNWASDPEVTKYLYWQPHADIEVTRGILAEWDQKNAQPDYSHWGLEIKATGQLIGAGGSVSAINERHRSAEIGYCLSRAHWGRGYMTEAVSEMIRHLFLAVGLNRIAAYHDPENIGSGRVMQKCGMMYEGTQRQARFSETRGFYDLMCYAILKEDYK